MALSTRQLSGMENFCLLGQVTDMAVTLFSVGYYQAAVDTLDCEATSV